ncbi:hypothetical protein STSR3_77 [Salmonella virus STSR3]|nr:hypothetical protein STSR3_77 [Salmonella virus STSR3]
MNEIMEQIYKLAPAFKKVDPALLEAWIELAEDFVCRDRFGDKYNRAVALYTLHLMTLDGAMKSEKKAWRHILNESHRFPDWIFPNVSCRLKRKYVATNTIRKNVIAKQEERRRIWPYYWIAAEVLLDYNYISQMATDGIAFFSDDNGDFECITQQGSVEIVNGVEVENRKLRPLFTALYAHHGHEKLTVIESSQLISAFLTTLSLKRISRYHWAIHYQGDTNQANRHNGSISPDYAEGCCSCLTIRSDSFTETLISGLIAWSKGLMM